MISALLWPIRSFSSAVVAEKEKKKKKRPHVPSLPHAMCGDVYVLSPPPPLVIAHTKVQTRRRRAWASGPRIRGEQIGRLRSPPSANLAAPPEPLNWVKTCADRRSVSAWRLLFAPLEGGGRVTP